jgi:hypothetical protein
MTTAITLIGEALIANKQANVQSLNINKMVFAYVDGVDHNAPVNRSDTMPAVEDIVSTLDITQVGRLNNNTIVYSVVMGTDVGDFTFNWMGLYSEDDDALITVSYLPDQEKRKTEGEVTGNVVTKNIAVEFSGASDLTGVSIDAESWQVDYTARLRGMDNLQRDMTSVLTNQAMFKNDGFKIKYQGASFYLCQGECIVDGLYFSNNTDLPLTISNLPKTAWLEVWQEQNMAGILNRFQVVYNDGSAMLEIIKKGEVHRFIKLALVNSTASIDDERTNVTDSFALYHQGNMPDATTSQKGIVKLIDSVTSTSTSLAPTAKALKTAYDKGQSAYELAEKKAPSSHSHGVDDLPAASTSQSGIVQLSSLIDSESEETAPTSAALNAVNEKVNSQEIIQGSNSNGYYTKFPDGRLICGHNMLINAPDNLQGSIYYSGDSIWTFPHEFALNQVDFVGGLASTSSRYEWIVGYGFNGSYGLLQRKSSISDSYAQYRSVVAIGRWY